MLILKFSFFKFPAKTGLCYNMHVTYAFVTNHSKKKHSTDFQFLVPHLTNLSTIIYFQSSLIHVPNFGNSD